MSDESVSGSDPDVDPDLEQEDMEEEEEEEDDEEAMEEDNDGDDEEDLLDENGELMSSRSNEHFAGSVYSGDFNFIQKYIFNCLNLIQNTDLFILEHLIQFWNTLIDNLYKEQTRPGLVICTAMAKAIFQICNLDRAI